MVKSRIIGNGAEAVVTLSDDLVTKTRLKKSYRIKEIDDRITKLRTRAEVKLINRASSVVNVPKIVSFSEKDKVIVMSYVDGEKLSDILSSNNNSLIVAKIIGESVSKLHDNSIIHGDLTTSNMILDKDNNLFFVDFGLSFYSEKLEDKAVDIHLFKEALEAKHYERYNQLWVAFLSGYKNSKNYLKVLEQLRKVELRGRYRH